MLSYSYVAAADSGRTSILQTGSTCGVVVGSVDRFRLKPTICEAIHRFYRSGKEISGRTSKFPFSITCRLLILEPTLIEKAIPR